MSEQLQREKQENERLQTELVNTQNSFFSAFASSPAALMFLSVSLLSDPVSPLCPLAAAAGSGGCGGSTEGAGPGADAHGQDDP